MNPFYESAPDRFAIAPVIDHPYPEHVHHSVEIVGLMQGQVDMTVGGRDIALTPGCCAVVFPFVPHSYEKVSEDTDGVVAIFSPQLIPQFTSDFLNTRPEEALLLPDALPQGARTALGALRGLISGPQARLQEAYVHLLLAYLLPSLTLEQAVHAAGSDITEQVMQYISAHFTEPLTLESLGAALCVSRSHLSHIFSQQLKVHFRDYINLLRVTYAASLLVNESLSISEIVFRCGFENHHTFSRAFEKEYHMTPGQYRRGILMKPGGEPPAVPFLQPGARPDPG